MINLEAYLIPAEEGLFGKFMKKSNTAAAQPVKNSNSDRSISIAPVSYNGKRSAYKKLREIIKSQGFLPSFSGTLETDSDASRFTNYLNSAFSKIVRHSQFNILLKEIYEDAKNNDNEWIAEELDKMVYNNIKFISSIKYSNAIAFDYDFQGMSQDAFFYIDYETEDMLNIIVKHALGSKYLGKCYADDTAVFTVVKTL